MELLRYVVREKGTDRFLSRGIYTFLGDKPRIYRRRSDAQNSLNRFVEGYGGPRKDDFEVVPCIVTIPD